MKAKYSNALVELFREVFCWLPLVHVLNGKVMVVHGGLFSQEGVTLDDIRAIDRNMCESFLMALFHQAVPPTPSSDPSCNVSVQSGSTKAAAVRQTSSPRHRLAGHADSCTWELRRSACCSPRPQVSRKLF